MKWDIYRISLLLLLACCIWSWQSSPPLASVEICDNGIDDNANGLIDLNDPTCSCPSVEPISLIPNPSFEDISCCPNSNSQLNCADTWIQASAATTDYMHSCGWLGWEGIPLPLPIPDGEGCVGYRNGRFTTNDFFGVNEPRWKEYVGACLLVPMIANKAYTIRFNIGFSDAENSPPTEVAFYGTSDCAKLPFGGKGDRTFGCPSNDPNWQTLGSIAAVGKANSWIAREITIVPKEDIYAIAIGPSCKVLFARHDLFYFLDNLVLAEQNAFEFDVSSHGNPCTDTFSIQVPHQDTLEYQWYRDGIAIQGATEAALPSVKETGNYQLRITSTAGCKLTNGFLFERPFSFEKQEMSICAGERYQFQSQTLRESGIYTQTIKSVDQCDSIIELNLNVIDAKLDSIAIKIFSGETYTIGAYKFSERGEHLAYLKTSTGCDSLVHLDLGYYQLYIPNAFSPNHDGVNDTFQIFGDEDLIAIKSLRIFNRWGELVFSAAEFSPDDHAKAWDGSTPSGSLPNGVYIYSVSLLMEDGIVRDRKGDLTIVR